MENAVTAPVLDDELFGLRYCNRPVVNGVAVKGAPADELILRADCGQFSLTATKADGTKVVLSLSQDQVDGLIDGLPKLRNWMASGKPAGWQPE